ncbi:MAG: CAP domain-containing protein [Acidimicrobiia bacterium]
MDLRHPLRRTATVFLAILLALGAALATAAPAAASVDPGYAETEFLRLLNDTRRANGKAALVLNSALSTQSRGWSSTMASQNKLFHDPNLASNVAKIVPDWTRAGENVGVGYDVKGLHDAFWASTGHRANMLGAYNQVGIGVVTVGGKLWVTFRFVQGSLPAPAPEPATFHLRNSTSSGEPDRSFTYGLRTDEHFVGDWDGDGVDTPGVRRGSTFYLRNSNSGGSADVVFTYGRKGDVVLIGDWDGDGKDTLAVRRGRTYYLRNDLRSGVAQITFHYGRPDDIVLVGDWDGDQEDTLTVRRSRTYYVRNSLTTGTAETVFTYGRATDIVLVGDWDSDGVDTLGVRRGFTYYLSNVLAGGDASTVFSYGTYRDTAVVGDWDGDQADSVGVRR